MTDGKNFFDQSIKSIKITYENIRKNATGQADDYKLLVCQTISTLKVITKQLQQI